MARLFLVGSLGTQIAKSSGLLRVMWRLEASLLWAFWRISLLLGPDRGASLGERLLRWLGPKTRKAGHVRRNLEIVLGNDCQKVDEFAADVWGNLGRVLAEYPHLKNLCETEFRDRIEVETEFDLDELKANMRPKIFAGAHLANWEINCAASRHLGFEGSVIYSPQQNQFVEKLMVNARQALQCELVAKRNAMRALARELQQGRSVGVIVDQRVDDGALYSFFNVPAATTDAPARLALRYGADIVPVRCQRLDDGRYRVTFLAPLKPNAAISDKRDQARDLTEQLYHLFETWIRERPGQWHCLKRRWPKHATSDRL